MIYFSKQIPSPVGMLKLVGSERGLAAILWGSEVAAHTRFHSAVDQPLYPLLMETETQLADYFTGKRHVFSLPLDVSGTLFQQEVWWALLSIPYGETRSYAEIARQIERPKAVRAVGAANGMNPLSIVVPCHRVIGSNGKLTGFAGGLTSKAFLLNLEARYRQGQP